MYKYTDAACQRNGCLFLNKKGLLAVALCGAKEIFTASYLSTKGGL
jgi:hypothetical protein